MQAMLSPTAEVDSPEGGGGVISEVMRSNLYTMGLVSTVDPKRGVGAPYTIPEEETRRLRARLILEEAFETVAALGFDPFVDDGRVRFYLGMENVKLEPGKEPDLEQIIDGCCDEIYVCTGTLVSCGVPDVPHLREVCRANDSKFPAGRVILDSNGKFGKPLNWIPPDHATIQVMVMAKDGGFDLKGER